MADGASDGGGPRAAVDAKIDALLLLLEEKEGGGEVDADEHVASPEAGPLENDEPSVDMSSPEESNGGQGTVDDEKCVGVRDAQDVSVAGNSADAEGAPTTAGVEERLGAISSRLKAVEAVDENHIAQDMQVEPTLTEEELQAWSQRPTSLSPEAADLQVEQTLSREEYIGTIRLATSVESEASAMAPADSATKILTGEKEMRTDGVANAAENAISPQKEDSAKPPAEIAAMVAAVGRRIGIGESSPQPQPALKEPTDVADPDDYMEPKTDASEQLPESAEALPTDSTESSLEEATQVLGQEILFDDALMSIQAFDDGSKEARQRVQGWTNQRWVAAQKSLKFTAPVLRVMPGRFFWSADVYEKRIIAIYNNPDVILIMRLPKDIDEVRRLLPIQGGMELSEQELHQFLVVESLADPLACKVRLSQLTNATSLPSNKSMHNDKGQGLRKTVSNKNVPRRRACFDLLTPTEVATLSVAFLPDDSFEDAEVISTSTLNETHRCEDAIVSALVEAHTSSDAAGSNADQAWRHQVVLGTPHSYVISGNDQTLTDSLHQALERQNSQHGAASNARPNKVLFTIDATDDGGKTALHYACSRRQNSTVQILVGAGADCSVPQSSDMWTPCHMCAVGLDEKSLSVVLSSSYPTRPSPNALDNRGRTPMYLAAVEGRDGSGSRNAHALDLCLSALAAWGGQLISDSPKSKDLLHPVHCVSAQWEADVLSVTLSHCNYCYPLVDGGDLAGRSLSAKFHYPIHATLLSLRSRIVEACSRKGRNDQFNAEFMPQEPPIVKTIQTLLDHGFEPNERFEGIVGEGAGIKSFSRYFGYTPLQILALAAAEARAFDTESKTKEEGKSSTDTALIMRNITRVIKSCGELLVRNGARSNVPPPPPTRLDRETPAGCYSLKDALEGQEASSIESVYRKTLNLEGKEETLSLFGSSQRLGSCQNIFAEAGKSVDNTTSLTICSLSVNSDAPGGSDQNSCAICWSEFGVISNRKHLCRVSCRNVCNECSRKRLVDNGTEHRVSDGQFLLAKAEARKAVARSQAKRDEHMHKQQQNVTQARKSLGLKSPASGGSAGADDKKEVSPADRLSNAIAGLGQAKNAVLERGDKLEGIADKAERLNKASVDFAKMAKELERSQNSWW